MKHAITLVLALGVVGGVAYADKDKDKGEALFKEGRKLMEQKRYADACKAFEESNKLDPGLGAQANVGKCYQEWDKLAMALKAYQAAAEMAKRSNDRRLAQ